MNTKDTRIDLDRHASYGETVIARRIVRLALERGWKVSVYDGDAYTKPSDDRMTILSALASTEADWLKMRDSEGKLMGQLLLVWGNDPSGEELVADYTVDGTTDSPWTLFISDVSRPSPVSGS